MSNTQKVGSTGRYGPRYGVGIRRKLLKVEPLQYQKHVCPSCGSANVKRSARGIFECRKCSHEFVGGAYLPQTLAGTIIRKMVLQKVFSGEQVQTLAKVIEAPSAASQEANKADAPKREKRKKKQAEVSDNIQEEKEENEGGM